MAVATCAHWLRDRVVWVCCLAAVRSDSPPPLLIIHSFIHYDFRLTRVAKDLFNVQIGKVSRVSLAYGPNGTSKGVATIQFAQKGDAKKAYDRYDGKLIDNTRRLKVYIPKPSPQHSYPLFKTFFLAPLPLSLLYHPFYLFLDPCFSFLLCVWG